MLLLLLVVLETAGEPNSFAAARPNQKNKIIKTKMMAKALRISIMIY